MSRADIFRKALELEETIAALKRENAALREREGLVAVGFDRWLCGESYDRARLDEAFAAFRNSPDYPLPTNATGGNE